MKKLPAVLRKIVNKCYYDPLFRPLNDWLYLQHRPAFDFKMEHDPGAPWDLYRVLKQGKWEHDRFDLVRYYCLFLLLTRIDKGKVPGDVVELVVHRGNTAEF